MIDTEKSTGNGEQSLQEKAREEIRKEITQAKAEGKQSELAARLLQELKDAETPAKEFIKADIEDKTDSRRTEGNKVLKTLTRVAEAAKAGIVIVSQEKVQKLLAELAEKSLSPSTASAIETNLKDFLYGGKDIVITKKGQSPSDFEKALTQLKISNPIAAELVENSLISNSTAYGQSENELREKFNEESKTTETVKSIEGASQEEIKKNQEFYNDYTQYYSRYFTNEEDIDLLKALYKGDRFIEYVNKKTGKNIEGLNKEEVEQIKKERERARKEVEDEIKSKKESVNEEEVVKRVDDMMLEEVSELIGRKLTNMLDRVHVLLSRERATETYEEVAQRDFLRGITATINAMRGAIGKLGDQLSSLEKQGYPGANMKLYKHSESKRVTEPVKIKGEEIEKTYIILKPLLKTVPVNLKDFVIHLEADILNHYTRSRAYLHNVNTIFNRPADPERGFYSSLAGYAELLQGTDLDAILSLPDGGLIMDAFYLYDKFLDEQFAKQDWKHEPDQFTNMENSTYSHLQKQVLEALKKAHPDYDENRLSSALYMAIGLSRGVFLNEVEKAGYADPPLTPTGGFTGASYYTNDVSALMVFNPSHTIMRWQGENNLYPFVFLPLSDLKGINKGFYDHTKMWDNMRKYRESYWKGRQGLEGKRLLIDDLVDFGNVGGPSKRRSWRTLFFAKDYFVWKKDEKGNIIHKAGIPQAATPLFDVLKTWQNIEKIGYEVIFDFVTNGRIDSEFLKANNSSKAEQLKLIQERNEFFKYLYKTYFSADESGFEGYMNGIRNIARDKLMKKISEGSAAPDSIEDQIQLDTSNLFLTRVIPRYVAKTFPSKFLRIDRDRFNKEGKSRWKETWKEMGEGWNPDRFDAAMKNLGLAESLLRRGVSDEMKKQLKDKNIVNPEDFKLDKIKYELNIDIIKNLFKIQKDKGANITDSEVDDVLNIFEKINKKYSGNDAFLNNFADSIGSNPETFYTFTFGIEQTDVSFLLHRRAGPRTIPRAIGDISLMEMAVVNHTVMKLQDKLLSMAIGEKKGDFSPIIESLKEVFNAYLNVHGADAGYEAIEKLSSAVIAFFKKDSLAKGPLGMLIKGGRRNSIAAEIAGRSGAVWEWDSTDIDKFVISLESNGLLKKDPFNLSIPATYEPIYFNPNSALKRMPLLGRLPFEKIPILNNLNFKTPFKHRKADYQWNGHKLRVEFGGNWNNIMQDFIFNYGPLFLAFMLWKYISESLKESEGKKQ